MKFVYFWGSFLFKYRNTVFPVFLAILFVIFPPVLYGGSLQSDLRIDLVGIALCIAGQVIRGSVIGFAYIKRGGLNKKSAATFVRRESEKLPVAPDRGRFAELAETELTSLHEGNFARYRLRPAEFAAWRKTWR